LNLVRFVVRALACLIWVILGLITIALVYWILGLKFRLWSKKYWSRVLLWICGIKVALSGQPIVEGATLFVANHVSWLDIFVMNYVRATAFIAKSEIRKWPVAGWLATGADTIFIERGSRHAVHAVAKSVHEHFERAQAVGLFPEGTTSEGFDVLPFYANLFEPARKAQAIIQPVALRYFYREQRSSFPAFVGEETLLMNMWRVFGTTGVRVEMVFLPALNEAGHESAPRAVLCKAAQASIQAALTSAAPTQ
jgi:1-acyl-sn-glycerol-3-phosphate acyltransferase